MTLTSNAQLGAQRIELADAETVRVAHLLRRAGFGPTRAEIERAAAQGYEATVEELLYPDAQPDLEIEDLIRRYHVDQNSLMLLESSQGYWLYRIINSRRPLEEKMALFWHGLFATAYGKLNHAKAVVNQTAHLPPARAGQVCRHPAGIVPGPGDDFLAGQQGQPQGRSQRKLRARVAGAVLNGHRQLHRGRRKGGGPVIHRLDD